MRRALTSSKKSIVTATLREQSLLEAPVSITVLDEQTLRDAGRQHFEDVLAAVPNLHWAGGTSRPRLFPDSRHRRARAVRRRAESVGRLPDRRHRLQRHRHARDAVRRRAHRGAARSAGHALRRERAGGSDRDARAAIPADEFGFATEASVGEYDSESLGAVATGPVEALNSAWRVAVQRYRSDGFRRDAYPRSRRHQRSRRAHGAREVALAAERGHDRRSHLAARRSRQRLRRLVDRQYTPLARERSRQGCAALQRILAARADARQGRAADLTVIAALADFRQHSRAPCYPRPLAMISFSRISKQYGRQVLFVDASFQLNPGEKVGLVGPERRGQDHALPPDRRRGGARRGRGLGAQEAHDRLLPPGRRGDVGPLGARRGDRGQRPARRPAPRARGAAARDGRSRRARTRWTRSSRASARCRRSTTTSAATRSRRRRARSCTASASTTSASTATWARSPAAGRCASPWPACCSAGPTCC